ncbi:MAG TPA: serine hydrolase domain-containing protein [Burkholderiaceae bacterium]|nr:serine hydrolase domain-containing protein [Burkholderiaceae bacterium]
MSLIVGGCASTPRVDAGVTDSFDWALHPAEEAGLSRSGLDGLRTAVQKHIDNNQLTGAVTAVARHNKLVWHEAQGLNDLQAGTPMRKDDLFRMMSSTKPVTAVAVLMMVEEGKLSLEDKVSRFIPEFKDQRVASVQAGAGNSVTLVPAHREITVKDLLTHTSGLSSLNGLVPGPASSKVNKIERRPDDTLADYIPRLGAAALDFQPGSRWGYSALDGFDVLLRIVEIVSRQKGDVFLQERLFQPLGMRDTCFNVPPENRPRVLTLYGREQDRWKAQKPMLGDGLTRYIFGAGGLYSTAHDFLLFELMLLNKGSLNGNRILKPETVALMSRNHVGALFAEWFPPLSAGKGFGLGVSVVEDASKGNGRGVGAFGWGGAYGTETWVDPELDVAAVLLVQQPVDSVRPAFQQALRAAIVA